MQHIAGVFRPVRRLRERPRRTLPASKTRGLLTLRASHRSVLTLTYVRASHRSVLTLTYVRASHRSVLTLTYVRASHRSVL
ncbi:hypothetical protein, partial [Methanoculleus sp.]|uniref:hypothetical protein n=1 Tax=Methanoculleus sp. TaxID=90427 RepID=UPI001BD6545A